MNPTAVTYTKSCQPKPHIDIKIPHDSRDNAVMQYNIKITFNLFLSQKTKHAVSPTTQFSEKTYANARFKGNLYNQQLR